MAKRISLGFGHIAAVVCKNVWLFGQEESSGKSNHRKCSDLGVEVTVPVPVVGLTKWVLGDAVTAVLPDDEVRGKFGHLLLSLGCHTNLKQIRPLLVQESRQLGWRVPLGKTPEMGSLQRRSVMGWQLSRCPHPCVCRGRIGRDWMFLKVPPFSSLIPI